MSDTEMKEIPKKRDSESSKSSASSSRDHKPVEIDDPEVGFIQPNHSEAKQNFTASSAEFTGLTKEDLMQYAKDPFWRKVRLILFILFWVLWFGMLAAAIIIIVVTPKCPKIPKQTFWQKSSGYMIDVSMFKDTNGDGVGDIKGVQEKLGYVAGKAGFIVLQSVIAGSLGNGKVRSPAITDFKGIDSKVGTKQDMKNLLKECRKLNLKAVIQFYPHTGMNHPWFQSALKSDPKYEKYYYWSKSNKSKMVNRVGKSVWNKVEKGFFWSSLHSSLPALDLKNSDLLLDLKDAVQFWLNEGFDGIYIDDASFLVPNASTTSFGSGLTIKSSSGDLRNWYATGHEGQLYTAGSVEFIKQVRTWVDEVKERTDRDRLFLVSPGNTGLVHDQNQTLQYLGDAQAQGAHSVVLFDLVKSLGAKVVKPSTKDTLKSRIDNALKSNAERLMLTTQTIPGPRSTDALPTFMSFLLPGTTLTIYGEEIGIAGYGTSVKAKNPNPNLPYSFITEAALENVNFYLDDLVDAYNVPMQWSLSGGFTANKTLSSQTFPDTNVMAMSALGRGVTRYNVIEELVKLQKVPSLNWGAIEWVETNEADQPNFYILSRSAPGFPKYVAVLMQPSKQAGGIARDLSKVCKTATPKLSFPPNEDFAAKQLSMKNLYFRFNSEGSVYVFACDK